MNDQTSESLLDQILDELPDAVTYMKPVFNAQTSSNRSPVDFSFTYVNDKAAKVVGLNKNHLLNRTIFGNHSIALAKQELFEQILKVYTTGERHEFSYKHPETRAHIDVLRIRFREGVLNISRDKRAQQKAELELMKKNEQLEHSIAQLMYSNENLERYAYVASHDLQEPLRKIITYSEMLERRLKDALGEQGISLIDKMKDAGLRMDRLIKDLLSHSRLSDKPQAFEEVDLNEVLKEVLTDLETSLTSSMANVQVSELRHVQGSRLQIRQLFQNLISNSLKFVKPGQRPEIEISAKRIKGKDSHVPVNKRDEEIFFEQITVCDNGIGFEPSQSDKIFQIFHRLNGRNYPGSGVGLSIVKKVIEMHQGYITAQSETGKGATFTILLPLPD